MQEDLDLQESNMTTQEPPAYYANHGDLTDPKDHRALLDGLPLEVAGLCHTIQGLLIHDYYGLHLYGPPPPGHDHSARATLPIAQRLAALPAASDRPVWTARPPFERSVGTCRDFSLMLCAMLRHRSVPARVRCGFARYFDPPRYEDHWICEYWKPRDRRWAVADAQLDAAHQRHLAIGFDITDVPNDQFIFAWQAWRRCRSGSADAAHFGHGADTGEWFLRVNLARDLLSLGKRETSAWDRWRDAQDQDRTLDHAAVLQGDRTAALAQTAQGLAPPDLSADEIQRFLSLPPWQD